MAKAFRIKEGVITFDFSAADVIPLSEETGKALRNAAKVAIVGIAGHLFRIAYPGDLNDSMAAAISTKAVAAGWGNAAYDAAWATPSWENDGSQSSYSIIILMLRFNQQGKEEYAIVSYDE